jgi:hypothetical protein
MMVMYEKLIVAKRKNVRQRKPPHDCDTMRGLRKKKQHKQTEKHHQNNLYLYDTI